MPSHPHLVAVVAGATRGAGRGIARGLGETGATVYCTGRSVDGSHSPYGRPETIQQTAAMVDALGGRGIAVQVDHTDPAQVRALFARVEREHGRLDVLADSVAGQDPQLGGFGPFLQSDLDGAGDALRHALASHLLTARHGAPLMTRAGRGLIVQITDGDMVGGGHNLLAGVTKGAIVVFAYALAQELRPHGVASLAITPGFLRSEMMLQHFGVTEANWRDAGKADPHFLQSETPLFLGRAVAALAADPEVMAQTGTLTSTWELARRYGFTDADGSRPDWGRHFERIAHTIPFVREGLPRTLAWLEQMAARARRYLGGGAEPAQSTRPHGAP